MVVFPNPRPKREKTQAYGTEKTSLDSLSDVINDGGSETKKKFTRREKVVPISYLATSFEAI